MNKRANLAAAQQTTTRGGDPVPAPATVPAIRASTPSRIGKKTVAAHFDPAVSRQLKQLGLDKDTSTQALLREAINDLFAKYGKPPIA
jgi:hypothetical protein